jgi:hypothetical protein
MSTSEAVRVADLAAVPSSRRSARLLRRLLLLAGFVVLAWLVSGTREASAADPLAAYAHQRMACSDPILALTTAAVPARRVTDLGSVPAGAIGRGTGWVPVERGIDIAPTLLSSLPVAQAGPDALVAARPVTGMLIRANHALDTVVGQRGLAHGLGSAPLRTAQELSTKPAITSLPAPSSSTLDSAQWTMSAHSDAIAALARSSSPYYPLSVPDRSGPLQPGTPAPASHGALSGPGSADGQPALVSGYGEPRASIVGYVTAPVSNSLVRHWVDQPGTSPD